MARIVYSMAGEGRGHATRVRAVVEQLRGRHEVILYAPGDAHDLLEPTYRGTEVEVRPHPCLRFHYTGKRLDTAKTLAEAGRFLWDLPALLNRLSKELERLAPDLVITDFEPALPRAAKRVGIPFLSLDHQHFLLVNDLRILPRWLRARAWIWGRAVHLYFRGQEETIVSSFYQPPIRKAWRGKAVQIATLLRPEVLKAERANHGHLLLYLRKFATPALMEALAGCGKPVHVFGLGEQPSRGQVRFHAIDQAHFLEKLATCDALLSTAGNQVVGEALFLGKPVLAMPEPANYEQYINAHYLADTGCGEWAELAKVTPEAIRGFLDRGDELRSRIVPERFNGNPAALAAIARHLGPRTVPLRKVGMATA